MDVDKNRMAPLSEAAEAAGVAVSTVKMWRIRGWYAPNGKHQRLTVRKGRDGKYRYRVGDVLQAEVDTSANPNSRRPPEVLAHAA